MNRIKELRQKKNMTLKQVADAIGVSEATAQRYESGKINSLKYEKAEALAKLFNVSPGYLMGWNVDFDSFEATPSTWADKDQKSLFEFINKYGEKSLSDYIRASSGVPLYEAAAGEGRTTDWYATEEISIKHESDTSAVRVIGNSMHPTIQDGDVVIVRAQSVIDYPHQIALVKIDGEDATLKRVEVKDNGLMLIADNIDVYSPHFYTAKEVETLPVKIEGVVVQLIRNMR